MTKKFLGNIFLSVFFAVLGTALVVLVLIADMFSGGDYENEALVERSLDVLSSLDIMWIAISFSAVALAMVFFFARLFSGNSKNRYTTDAAIISNKLYNSIISSTPKELDDYIVQMRTKGLSNDLISSELRRAGWDEDMIVKALT